MRSLRESYAAKLFAGLLGTVGVLLVVASVVVRSETSRQVQLVSERAVRGAATQFAQVEEIRRQEVARVARPLTEGRRTLAALDEAIEAEDRSVLAGLAQYELDLAGLTDVLVAFTDTRGRPVLTLHGSSPMEGLDPAGLQGVAARVLAGEAMELGSYRVLDGTLFSVRTGLIQLAGRAIGTLSLGLPVPDEEVARTAGLVGVEVCFVVEGACVAGSPTAREGLAEELVHRAGMADALRVEAMGTDWSVHSQPLMSSDPSQGYRVVAVPLAQVVAPFRRITRALVLGGALALLLSVVVGVGLSRGLTRPVRALVAATGRVAKGDYETEVPVTTRDELGTLAQAFNDMTHGLLLKERLRLILDVVSSREVAEELVKGGLELGGENRRVTVLFADIRGFSALTEGMEPQAVIALLNECMQLLSDAVVAEGGHVDKFVGDELMAVFNAPKQVEDHTGRALRAAVGMQRAMRSLNAQRAARGEELMGLGVGVNTGEVVAGKMGSQTRNNYTVLGDAVNLASRLCSAAEAGQVLATRRCVSEAATDVEASSLGGRAFKGFTEEFEVMAVTGVSDPVPRAEGPAPRGGMGPALALALLALLPAGASAQRFPTLRELGAEAISSDGRFQVTLSGQLDVEAFLPSDSTFGLVRAGRDGGFVAPRVRLFTDVFAGDHVYGFLEVRGDRGAAPRTGDVDVRLEQAFLRLMSASGAVSLQVGRFASPFGSYPQRHLTPGDPFVRPPLLYDYRTTMCPGIAPPSTSAFLTWPDRPDEFREIGAPPVWDVPYPWGAMIAGGVGAVRYRLAAVNSAPSSGPSQWGWDGTRMKHPSWVAGVGLSLSPAWSLGASFSRGPWLEALKKGSFPAGRDRWDYRQTLVSVDMTYARGPVVVRAEGVRDQWDVPNLTQAPVEWGGSLEVQVDVAPGLYVAGRGGFLDFRPVEDGPGTRDWDWDVQRYEVGAGYRVDRNAGIQATWSGTTRRSSLEGARSLLSTRFWWAF